MISLKFTESIIKNEILNMKKIKSIYCRQCFTSVINLSESNIYDIKHNNYDKCIIVETMLKSN